MAKQNISPEKILEEMTLEEKASLVNGGSFFGMAPLPRFDIPALQLLDGGTGINFEQLFGDIYSRMERETNSTNGMVGSTVLTHVIDYFYEPDKLTEEELEVRKEIEKLLLERTKEPYAPGCFPPGILLGATFDPKLIEEVGEALGAEARLFGVHILLGSPNVNIHRDPLNGRLFEGYSEDPCLVSTLAPHLVKGVQKFHVAANVKHFAANNQETRRVGINETISMRALQEIYYPGFKACVQEGEVKTLMSAYNLINGVPCTENENLLTKELRNRWGFTGSVVSDWGAVYHPIEALHAGNDLAMPGPLPAQPILDAVTSGKLSVDILDKAVLRLLKTIQYCFENPLEEITDFVLGNHTILVDKNTKGEAIPESRSLLEATKDIAYRSALGGIVLLKNNGLYPLKEGNLLLTGQKDIITCGTGSAGITTDRNSDFETCLRNNMANLSTCAADHYTVLKQNTSAITCAYVSGDNSSREYDYEVYFQHNPGANAILTASVSGMEGNDRPNMFLAEEDRLLLEQLISLKKRYTFTLTLILNVCGPVDVSNYEKDLDAIWCIFLPGMEGAHALADLMCGKASPSGKLPLTFPKHYEDTPTFLNFPGEGYEVNYGEGIFVGYRYYDKKNVKPAYPFGYGLSYTTFAIDDMVADKEEFEDEVNISVKITNTGSMAGAEVIQLYIGDKEASLPKPVKELKAFRKVFLQPGESKMVTFRLCKKDFASFDPDHKEWIAEEGFYQIFIATSSAAEDIKTSVRVYLDTKSPYSYGLTSPLKTLYEKKPLKEALVHLWNTLDWDMQILASNYQYTPYKTIEEIMPASPTETAVAEFLDKVSKVRH